MEKTVQFACSLDCFDTCALIATVRDNKIIGITGDKKHPLTNGHICAKGRKHLSRLYHPDRVLNPKKRLNGNWYDISWQDALEEISDNLKRVKNKYGSQAVLHHSYSGHSGLLKSIDNVFFNYFGGVTQHTGSLCLRAGETAQKYDFGNSLSHDPKDMVNSKTILIWGKNCADTQLHLIQYLKKARNNGACTILIDPTKTATAEFVDHHIKIKPATDCALALGIASYISKNSLYDMEYIQSNVIGFTEYREYLKDFTPEKVEKITGVPEETIQWLAKKYAKCKPSTIHIGYGLQRYKNGGNTVRCIDSLGAVTGNIGIPGGGVNYMNNDLRRYIGGILKESYKYARNRRLYNITRFADYILNEKNPPIKTVFIVKANPLVQNPNIKKTIQALRNVDFKVAIDMFMTDSARYADIFLPCTSVCEENDFIYNSCYSPYLVYSQKVVDPPDNVMSEYDFFAKLAQKTDLTGYPLISKGGYLKSLLEPLTNTFYLDYETLKKSYFKIPGSEIPWQTGTFSTPSGKYELYSEKALKEGHAPLPVFSRPNSLTLQYPIRLLSPHHKDSMHSQHFMTVDGYTKAYINKNTRQKYAIVNGTLAIVTSPNGHIKVKVEVDDRIYDNTILIYEGWWHKSGSVNLLTNDFETDMGKTSAFNECFCSIKSI